MIGIKIGVLDNWLRTSLAEIRDNKLNLERRFYSELSYNHLEKIHLREEEKILVPQSYTMGFYF